jgi:hypothetical protein
VVEQSPNKDWIIVQKLEHVRASHKTNGTTSSYDSAVDGGDKQEDFSELYGDWIRGAWKIRLSGNGRCEIIERPATPKRDAYFKRKIPSATNPEPPRVLAPEADILLFGAIPSEPVKKGDKWRQTTTSESEGMVSNVTVNFTYEGRLGHWDVIHLDPSLSVERLKAEQRKTPTKSDLSGSRGSRMPDARLGLTIRRDDLTRPN